ncbi:MAG: hypothetical protein Q8L23_18215 [Caulobacter sp.]|nr:hypothetical protein [Caulobacter sp.]
MLPGDLFILRNESAEPMRLTVVAAERIVWQGDLRAGGVQIAFSDIDRETDVTVTCATPGTAPVTVRGNYMMGGVPPQIATIRLPSCAKADIWVEMLP